MTNGPAISATEWAAPLVTFGEGGAALTALLPPPAPPFRMPPGSRGHANAGVMAIVLPHATPAHLADMAKLLVEGEP